MSVAPSFLGGKECGTSLNCLAGVSQPCLTSIPHAAALAFFSGSVFSGAEAQLVSILCTKALRRLEDGYSVPTPQLFCLQAKQHYFLPPPLQGQLCDRIRLRRSQGRGSSQKREKTNTNTQAKGLETGGQDALWDCPPKTGNPLPLKRLLSTKPHPLRCRQKETQTSHTPTGVPSTRHLGDSTHQQLPLSYMTASNVDQDRVTQRHSSTPLHSERPPGSKALAGQVPTVVCL